MPRGRAAIRRLVLETLGWLLVVAGIAALILPGPGLLMLFGGLAILSQQYDWAERRMRPVEWRAKKAAAESVQTWPRIVMSIVGAAVIAAFGVLWLVQPAPPDWWPIDDNWWLPGGWPTGITLDASAVIVLVMLVYSFRKYRGRDPDDVAEEARSGNRS